MPDVTVSYGTPSDFIAFSHIIEYHSCLIYCFFHQTFTDWAKNTSLMLKNMLTSIIKSGLKSGRNVSKGNKKPFFIILQ